MDDTIRQYIDRALEVSRTGDHKLTAEELAEIARDIGLTDADLARVDRAVEDGLTRGTNYLRQKMWDDAVRELEGVTQLAPTNINATLALAEGHVGRYVVSANEHDNRTARALLTEVLNQDPDNQQAYELLNQVTRPLPKWTDGPPFGAGALRMRLGWKRLVAAGLLVAAFWGLISGTDTRPPSFRGATFSHAGSVGVTFVDAEGIAWDLRHAENMQYGVSSHLQIWGTIEVTSNIEVEQLTARVTITDATGLLVEEKGLLLVGMFDPVARPGDKRRFSFYSREAPTGLHAKIEVTHMRATPSIGSYAASKPVKLSWRMPPPADMSLEVFERQIKYTNPIDKRYFRGEWELHNTGTSAMSKLAFNVYALNERGERTRSDRFYAITAPASPLLPGDIDAMRASMEVAEGDVGYEFEVDEIK